MGKNSNAHKSQKTTAMDLQREREDDAKKAARREKKLAALGMSISMDVERADAAAPKGGKKVKKFGKVMVGSKRKMPSIGKALEPKKRPKLGGIRKPSALMRKTLKKLSKKSEMEL